jgi:glyoxylase-like metal-dependent hydrolase (beta-lactamase superfamily II)
VPKTLWQRQTPADDRNRIDLDTNCLLVRTANKLVLIDTGYGGKATEKERDIFALDDGSPLLTNLAEQNVSPDDIDIVVLTHLHFDHAGGCTTGVNGKLQPTFPNARHFAQRTEWEDATSGRAELAGTYIEQHYVPLEEAGQLELIDGDTEIVNGISTQLTGGHTRGHQAILIGGDDYRAVYPADISPTTAHLRAMWGMAYDQFPLDVRSVKPELLGEAADRQWLVLFAHDPNVKAAYIQRDEKKEFVVSDIVEL